MSSLSSLVRLVEPKDLSSEDILNSCAHLLLGDRYRNLHGDPGSEVVYTSYFGEIQLSLADTATVDHGDHFLFAHYLWNASLQLAELIGRASQRIDSSYNMWDPKDQIVLELGAGSGLAGITCAMAGAESVYLSDYPSPPILETIKVNVRNNLDADLRRRTTVQGHKWGETTDEFSHSHAGYFTRILCADCIWMLDQHANMLSSLQHLLAPTDDSRIWVVAGFHTGRHIVVMFFEAAKQAGFECERIWEQDHEGNTQPWRLNPWDNRDDIEERRKWLVIASLKRSSPPTS